ncbi:hypothetical protein AAKU67_003923 [Oxalobacteraceae bacterium GrIS 2.11]
MSVSFQSSRDGTTMTLTPAGRAFIKSEEMKILGGEGDEYFKANKIHQMYLMYGVEEDGSYDKCGWREANLVSTSTNDELGKSKNDTEKNSIMDLLHTLKWAAVGVGLIYIYQTLHGFYLSLLR